MSCFPRACLSTRVLALFLAMLLWQDLPLSPPAMADEPAPAVSGFATAENDNTDPASADTPLGSLLLIGGAERFDNQSLWQTVVREVGGPGQLVIVLPMASGIPAETGPELQLHLQTLGLRAEVAPVGVKGFPLTLEAAAQDADIAAQIRRARGLFLLGGDQGRLMRAFRTAQNQPTPLYEAVRAVYQRGGLIAGTSAGTAVMSDWMYRDAEFVLPTLHNGVTVGKEVDRGLGLLDSRWMVDQHFLTRGRIGRLLVAQQTLRVPLGLGIEEDTAVLVRRGRTAEVLGYRGVVLVDARQAALAPANRTPDTGFGWSGVQLSYLNQQDTFDLETLEITPSRVMQQARHLLPGTPQFRPYYRRRFVTSDILGNMTLLDAMIHVVDSPFDDAIGLAFDPAAALTQPVSGFRFRLYRTADTEGWNSGGFGGDDYTISRVGLEVTPMKLAGPLLAP